MGVAAFALGVLTAFVVANWVHHTTQKRKARERARHAHLVTLLGDDEFIHVVDGKVIERRPARKAHPTPQAEVSEKHPKTSDKDHP